MKMHIRALTSDGFSRTSILSSIFSRLSARLIDFSRLNDFNFCDNRLLMADLLLLVHIRLPLRLTKLRLFLRISRIVAGKASLLFRRRSQ